MAVLSNRVILLFSILLYYSSATRFLPFVVWDNVNPILCCPYNWLVVPGIDLHDIIELVCPTTKLVVKQLNYQTRSQQSMNFNIYKREWKGSVDDLKLSISNGSIHSFCNASNQESLKLHTCRGGEYDSFRLKFTRFVFDADRVKYDKYEKDKTYVFFNYGDGYESTLDYKKAKCGMFFAVHIEKEDKRRQFDITYQKEVVNSKCKCNSDIKPTLHPTKPIIQEAKTTTPLPTKGTISTLPPPTTTSETKTVKSTMKTNADNIKIKQTTKSSDSDDLAEDSECKGRWISVAIFVAVVLASFIVGILCTVVFFQLLWRKPSSRRDGYNNAFYTPRELESPSTNGTFTQRSEV